jgi:hypothetical protein
MGLAEQKTDRRRIRLRTEESVNSREIEVELARPLGFELSGLEFDDKKAVQADVVEEQVKVKGVVLLIIWRTFVLIMWHTRACGRAFRHSASVA